MNAMKLIQVYVRNDWLQQNTNRQKFREVEPKDVLSISAKVLKAAPLLTIATAGMSKGMLTQSMSLLNFSMHILKQAHTGIGNVGKNKGCSFYEDIDLLKQKKLAGTLDGHPELPYAKLWLATDEDSSVIETGVLFYSKTEAAKFAEMYSSLDKYTQSGFYKYKGISVQIKEDDLPTFEKEMLDYLKVRENRLWSQLIQTQAVSGEHFIANYTDEYVATTELSETSVIQIDFPETVSQKELEKYFPETLKSLVKEEEKKLSSANIAEFESTNVYEALVQNVEELSDSELEDSEIEVDEFSGYGAELEEVESASEEYEKETEKGKEKPKSYLNKNKEEVVSPTTTSAQSASSGLSSQAEGQLIKESSFQSSSVDSDINPQASGKLSKKSPLVQSMSEGIFKTKEKEAKTDELTPDSESDATLKH
ncbi:hypothetical protein [Legionella drozanskii]|nr:hypothetical protein [Legionella drozanskii]